MEDTTNNHKAHTNPVSPSPSHLVIVHKTGDRDNEGTEFEDGDGDALDVGVLGFRKTLKKGSLVMRPRETWQKLFEETEDFFKDDFEEINKVGKEMGKGYGKALRIRMGAFSGGDGAKMLSVATR